MRIRTVKPEFWQDEEVSELPAETALLAIGLLNYADDEGYFKFHPKLIESSVFPLRELSRSVQGMLTELSSMGYITLHEGSDGKKYGHIVNFLKHQRVNKPSPSKIAPILVSAIEIDDSRSVHGGVTEESPTERNREQGKEVEQGTGKVSFCPPKATDESDGEYLPDEFFKSKTPPTAEVIDFIWKSVPQISRTRSSQVKLENAWKKIKASERPSMEDLENALFAWNNCSQWLEGYAQGVHLWIQNKQWNNLPNIPPTKTEAEPGLRDVTIGGRKGEILKLEEQA